MTGMEWAALVGGLVGLMGALQGWLVSRTVSQGKRIDSIKVKRASDAVPGPGPAETIESRLGALELAVQVLLAPAPEQAPPVASAPAPPVASAPAGRVPVRR